jgi:RNA polymerase sigma-70 factor (sigma-E family)
MPGEDPSFDQFVAAHARDLMGMAYVISCDESEAEDLVQECLLKIANRWRRVRKMERPYAYARRILVSLALDRSRGQARRRRELAGAGESGQPAARELVDPRADAAFDSITIRAPLIDALRELSPQQRAALVLRYFHDLSEAETAKLLGCGVGTVKSSTARGLARMREIVDPPPTYTRDVTSRSGSSEP